MLLSVTVVIILCVYVGVDLHLVRTDESQMRRLLSLSAAGPLHSSALTSTATDIQQNYQMKLAAGAVGQMKMKGSGAQTEHEESLLSSHEQTIKFGIASLPSAVLAESGGSQVFQLPSQSTTRHNTTHTQLNSTDH